MSLNQIDPDADFWDFVVCTKCYLPFSSDDAFTVPFWLTECGHVVCNNHLNPDQSCACCGALNVQVAALQRQMDPPMSEWFRSIPAALDTIAFSAKFQQEMLATQIRYYRHRHQQYRSFVERLKQEIGELRRTNKTLSSENDRLQQHLGSYAPDHQEPADFTNPHKKRPMMLTSHQYNQGSDYRSSSPRSITTPIGPSRITLPAGQPAPVLCTDRQRQPAQQHYTAASGPASHSRPVSSRQLQQYAFAPPDTVQYKAPPLSKAQAAPKYFQRTNDASNQNSNMATNTMWLSRQDTNNPHTQTGRPPLPKFKPSLPANGGRSAAPAPESRAMVQRQIMGPPETPHGLRSRPSAGNGAAIANPQVNRRFVPSTGALNGPGRSQQGDRSSIQGINGSGQRMPFVPK